MKKLLLVLPILLAGCSIEQWKDFHEQAEAYRAQHSGAPVSGQDEVTVPTVSTPAANPYEERFNDWSASS